MNDRKVPGVRVLCGISAGKSRRPHGVTLKVIGVVDRKLINPTGGLPALVHSNGTRWRIVVCSRHGALAVTERQILEAFDRWARNPKRGAARVAARRRVSAVRAARARP